MIDVSLIPFVVEKPRHNKIVLEYFFDVAFGYYTWDDDKGHHILGFTPKFKSVDGDEVIIHAERYDGFDIKMTRNQVKRLVNGQLVRLNNNHFIQISYYGKISLWSVGKN